ncbi:hypothetical protein LBMAG46_37120 [Planctomycetia bacterium]|nr:hypothetical protein LBMAG46_37120 [Planctomycetia bacterium]
MIDSRSETLIRLEQARREFPGKTLVSLAALHRWRLKGVRGVVLETLVVGGARYTSREAIDRFVAAQNAPESAPPQMAAEQRRAKSEAARAALASRGI